MKQHLYRKLRRWNRIIRSEFLLLEGNFAGHPTIGTCHAVIRSGVAFPHDGKIIQECGAGLVTIFVEESGIISFELPYVKAVSSSIDASTDASHVIGTPVLRSETFDVGPVWHTVLLETAEEVLAVQPDLVRLKELCIEQGWTGVQTLGKRKDGEYELRTFAPAIGVTEDPVCGSGSGAAMAFLRLPRARISQGSKLARKGFVEVTNRDGIITVGGHAVTVMSGEY